MKPFLLVVCLFLVGDIDLLGQGKKEFLIRASLVNGEEIAGMIKSFGDSSVHIVGLKTGYRLGFGKIFNLDSSKLNVRVKYDQLQSIEFRNKNSPRTGTFIGACLGFAIAFPLGNSADLGTQASEVALLIVPAATLVGAGIGSIYLKYQINGHFREFLLAKQDYIRKQR